MRRRLHQAIQVNVGQLLQCGWKTLPSCHWWHSVAQTQQLPPPSTTSGPSSTTWMCPWEDPVQQPGVHGVLGALGGGSPHVSTPHYLHSKGHLEAAVKSAKHLLKVASSGNINLEAFDQGFLKLGNILQPYMMFPNLDPVWPSSPLLHPSPCEDLHEGVASQS